jgi:hypothetical protein
MIPGNVRPSKLAGAMNADDSFQLLLASHRSTLLANPKSPQFPTKTRLTFVLPTAL